MKRYIRPQKIVLWGLLLILIGCSPAVQQTTPSLIPEIEKAMDRARHNIALLEELQVREMYALDFQEAQNALIEAERHVREGRQDLAYIATLNSLAATQRIFRQLYKEKTTASLEETKGDIRTILLEDPNNPLKEFLPLLNEILDYAERIGTGKKAIDFATVLEDLEKIAELGEQARSMSKLFVTEISFAPGSYTVSEDGKARLRKLSDVLIADRQIYIALYPNTPFIITVKVVGYADQIDFREETNFLRLLPDKVAEQIPQYPKERRQFLNTWLSEFRADATDKLLKDIILETSQENSQAPVNRESTGLGEEIPPEVRAPYPVQDPRRRICKIYAYITTK